MDWHTGRTVDVTLYEGDGPADMVGVMVGEHAAAAALARLVVERVNAHDGLVADLTAAREAVARAAAAQAAAVGPWRTAALALLAALQRYGAHESPCAAPYLPTTGGEYPCTCGFTAWLADLAQFTARAEERPDA